MIRDLTHMLITAPGTSESMSGGCCSEPAIDDGEDVRGLYWNLFAFPVSLRSGRYAFLTDQKSVVEIDESTFNDLSVSQGHPIPPSITDEQAAPMIDVGLVRRRAAASQFSQVFDTKASQPAGNALLHLITSYACNLTCSYCFMLADMPNHREKLLSFDDAKRGIDLYFSMPYQADSVIHFYGGEPLLHPQLVDDCMTYIHHHYSDQVLPKIITNGTLFGPRVLELLSKYQFDLSVSMDGDREAHDVFRLDHRGRSTFDKTVEGIQAFKKIGYEPKILITVGAHNIARLPEVVAAVLDLEPHAIALNFPRELPQSDAGLDDTTDPAFWVSQYEQCLDLCYQRNIPELYFADMLFAFLSGEPVLSPCAACGSQVSVGPGGQVGPCQAFVAAGMFSQPIEQFDSSGTSGPFQPWAKVSKASSRACSRCAIAPICGGDCSFDRYNRSKSLHEPLPFHCDLRLLMATRLTGRLIDGERLGFAAR